MSHRWTTDDVAAATGRFATGLRQADPHADVPACPGWEVHDLVAHLGNVHAWAAGVVAAGRPVDQPEETPCASLQEWYADRAGRLVDVLSGADPDAPCWNFAGVRETVGFWVRRQVLETLMHLVDLDQAHRRVTDLDPATCADGVSETFEVFLPRLHARGHAAELAGPVSFASVDTGETWTLVPDADGPPRLEIGGNAAVDVVTGTAEQLWLRLWRRGDAVTVAGDDDVVGRLLASRLSA